MDLLKEAGKYTEDQLLQMLSMSRVSQEIEKLSALLSEHKKAIARLEKKIAKLEKINPGVKAKGRGRKPASGKSFAKKAARKKEGSKVTMNDAILMVMKKSRKDVSAADLVVGVKKAGYQTKSNEKGLFNRMYNELSKLEKAKAIKRVGRGRYVIA